MKTISVVKVDNKYNKVYVNSPSNLDHRYLFDVYRNGEKILDGIKTADLGNEGELDYIFFKVGVINEGDELHVYTESEKFLKEKSITGNIYKKASSN